MPLHQDRRIVATGGHAARTYASFALVGALAVLGSLSALASLPSRNGSEPRAILFAPWVGGDQALARSYEAGYRVLRTGRFQTIVVVAAEDDDRPLPEGGWLRLALGGLAGCLDRAAAGERLS